MLTSCVSHIQGTFAYGGQTYDLIPSLEGASRAACERLVTLVLKQNEPCGAEQVSMTLLEQHCWSCVTLLLMQHTLWRRILVTDKNMDLLTLEHSQLVHRTKAIMSLAATTPSKLSPGGNTAVFLLNGAGLRLQWTLICLSLNFTCCHHNPPISALYKGLTKDAMVSVCATPQSD